MFIYKNLYMGHGWTTWGDQNYNKHFPSYQQLEVRNSWIKWIMSWVLVDLKYSPFYINYSNNSSNHNCDSKSVIGTINLFPNVIDLQ